ncbi:MAG: glycosyltransferase family 39 protein, partial [Dehalococcoidia bacterium]
MTDAEEALHSPSAAAATNGSPSRSLVGGFVKNVRELWSEHPRFVTSAAIVLLINFVLLGAYLWSRGGQTTHVRLEANGDTFSAYVDGRLMVESQFLGAPERGGIMLGIGGPRDIVPTRPHPRGIDSVRVTDLETGKVLFEDDFTDGPSAKWDVTPDVFTNDDGVLGATQRGTLTMFDPSWRNYALDVTYRNIAVGDMMVRASGADAGVFYAFRPFRHFDNALGFRAPGAGQTVTGPLLRMSSVETVKSIVAMALHPYPFALEVLAVGMVAVGALQFVSFKRIRLRLPAPPPDLPWLAIAVISGSTFGVLLFLITVYGKNLPHVPDAVSYIFQAKVLASGRLSVSPPPIPEVFDFFSPPFIVRHGDKWASIYPFAHPLALAIGERVGAMWLIPPLIGASTVGLLFILGKKIYNTRVGLLAAIMLASSPFFLMTGSNFMSHNTAAFYLVASLLFLAYIDKRPVLFGVLSGVFFGLVFNTRPLTSLALMPPFAAYLASLMAAQRQRPLGAQQVAAFLAGGLLMLGAYWLYNWGTTGDPFANGYQ